MSSRVKVRWPRRRLVASLNTFLNLSLLFYLLLAARASKPQQVSPPTNRASIAPGQQQTTNSTTTSPDPPSYIATGRKISKILNDFFDVSSLNTPPRVYPHFDLDTNLLVNTNRKVMTNEFDPTMAVLLWELTSPCEYYP